MGIPQNSVTLMIDRVVPVIFYFGFDHFDSQVIKFKMAEIKVNSKNYICNSFWGVVRR